MDKVFSLDISSTAVVALVAENDHGQIRIIDRLALEFPKNWIFRDSRLVATPSLVTLEGEVVENATSNMVETPSEIIDNLLNVVGEFYRQHLEDIISSIVIIPAHNYVGLNFTLPFNQDALVKKIINLEVQDLIPFALNKFDLNYKIQGRAPSGSYEIFTSLIPKELLEKIFSNLKKIGIEPDFITIPPAILQGASELNEAIMLVKSGEDCLYLTTLIDSNVKNVQVLELDPAQSFPETEVKMLLWNFEKMFSIQISEIKLLGNHFSTENLANVLGLPVTPLLPSVADQDIVATQAANALALNPEGIISNFREKKLSANKTFKLFLNYFLNLRIYLILFLVILFAIPIINYLRTDQEINLLQESIRNNIAQRITWIKFPVGKELETLMLSSGQIENQLQSLGSPAKSGPVDVYLALSDVLAEAAGAKIQMDLQQLVIKGNQVDLDGTVPNYKGVDRLEKIIKEKKDIFCRIKRETPGGGAEKRFQFKIKLC